MAAAQIGSKADERSYTRRVLTRLFLGKTSSNQIWRVHRPDLNCCVGQIAKFSLGLEDGTSVIWQKEKLPSLRHDGFEAAATADLRPHITGNTLGARRGIWPSDFIRSGPRKWRSGAHKVLASENGKNISHHSY